MYNTTQTSWSDLIITVHRLAQWFNKDSLLFEFQSIQNSNHLNNMVSPLSLSQLCVYVTLFSYYRLQEEKDYTVKLTLELSITARSVIILLILISDNDYSKPINVIFPFLYIPRGWSPYHCINLSVHYNRRSIRIKHQHSKNQ